MSSLQSLDIALRSATTTQPPIARHQPEVAKLIDVTSCIGCKACQVACMQWNDLRDDVGTTTGTYDNPRNLTPESWTVMRFSEVQREDSSLEWLIRKDGCMHCAEPGCLKACPAPGAIVKYSNGIVDFISEHCIGCGNCVTGCPFDVPRLSKTDNKAYKCSLCSDRVVVGLEPACVKACPTGAIRFGTKEDMHEFAAERLVDLKERGYANAGVYDPQGVGGTHVMYVLQHADRPEIYHGLPKDPHISPLVYFWKGVAKPLAVAAMIGAVFVSFFHYVKYGPIEVKDGLDDNERGDGTAHDAAEEEIDMSQHASSQGGPRMIVRYSDRNRINHWLVAFLFLCAGLTGLAIFHPFFYPLSGLFGGGVWTRILHPFMGVAMTLFFFGLFLAMWRENTMNAGDRAWLRETPKLMRGDESSMPPVGKNNAGQKLVFWSAAICLVVLLITGFVFWSPYFAPAFPVLARRIAVVLHALAGTVLILTIIVHIYAAIWVKGSVAAMTRGTVSEDWARFHHPLWWKKLTGR